MKYSPSFSIPKSLQRLTNVIMDGRLQQGNATIKRKNKTKTKQKQNHLHLWVDLMAVAPTLPIVTWEG